MYVHPFQWYGVYNNSFSVDVSVYNVSQNILPPKVFWQFSPNEFRIFKRNFTYLLYVPTPCPEKWHLYTFVRNFAKC